MPGRRAVTVLVYRPDEAERFASLVRAPRGVRVHAAGSPAEAEPVITEADAVWGWRVPAGLLAKAGRLRWLQVMGAGADWALIPELPARVVVTRSPGLFGPWMVEYVLAWCLWVTQRVEAYRRAQADRRWAADVLPQRLGGRTMVVVGLGDIGRRIARAAADLGLRVLGVSRNGRPVPGVARVHRPGALARVAAEGDFVVLVVPLTAETRGLVDERVLGAMKPTAWLVNVARGAVVDEDALVRALAERRIAGAVLDVFATEPLPPAHPLWALDNVVVTPHIAGPDVPADLARVFNDNLARFLAGRPLRHVVDRRRGY
ncbi:MAG TPA: D-2-hydroxyacid dehydrogenase [Calidithermus sp.]|nr:D-2-hydroxyacid dehydrogenase [Calidithermus sp.]